MSVSVFSIIAPLENFLFCWTPVCYHLCPEMLAMARMVNNAKTLAIQIGCQKWPLGEWRFWQNSKFRWRKIARGLAIQVRWKKWPLEELRF